MIRPDREQNRYNPYQHNHHNGHYKRHRPVDVEARRKDMQRRTNAAKTIQKQAKAFLAMKRLVTNETCPYTMERVRIKDCISLIDSGVRYMIDAAMLAEDFLRNYISVNPFTLRKLDDVEFMRICHHPNNLHIRPMLRNTWKNKEKLLTELTERRNLVSALAEDLDNSVVDALDYTDGMDVAGALDFLLDILPMQMTQIVDDLTAVDQFAVRDVLENSMRKLYREHASGVFKHIIRRHFVYYLDHAR